MLMTILYPSFSFLSLYFSSCLTIFLEFHWSICVWYNCLCVWFTISIAKRVHFLFLFLFISYISLLILSILLIPRPLFFAQWFDCLQQASYFWFNLYIHQTNSKRYHESSFSLFLFCLVDKAMSCYVAYLGIYLVLFPSAIFSFDGWVGQRKRKRLWK